MFSGSQITAVVAGEPRTLRSAEGEAFHGIDLAIVQLDAGFLTILEAVNAEAAKSTPPEPEGRAELHAHRPGVGRSAREGGASRRRADRKSVRIPTRLWGGGVEVQGTTLSISPFGAFIETATRAAKDTPFHLELELPARMFHYEAMVICEQATATGGAGLGVRFVPVEEALLQVPALGAESGARRLQLDLRDPARLATVYLSEIRHGGLSVPSAEPYAPSHVVCIELLLPPPLDSHPLQARVLHCDGAQGRLAVELLDPAAVKQVIFQVLSAHRPR
jgi:hypothetical protein